MIKFNFTSGGQLAIQMQYSERNMSTIQYYKNPLPQSNGKEMSDKYRMCNIVFNKKEDCICQK